MLDRFAALLEGLERASSEVAVHRLLCGYFGAAVSESGEVPGSDAAWAMALLRGLRVSRVWTQDELLDRARSAVAWPAWLFELSHEHVGDVAEVAALLFDAAGDEGGEPAAASLSEVLEALSELSACAPEVLESWVVGWWRCVNVRCGYLLNRLLLGGIRKCVEPWQLEAALAEVTGVSREVLALRIARGALDSVEPGGEGASLAWSRLVSARAASESSDLPEDFELMGVYGGGSLSETLGEPSEWLVEWWEDGLRVQVLRSAGGVRVWSEDGRALSPKVPELVEALGGVLPEGCSVEALLCAHRAGERLPLQALERRLARKRVTSKLKAEVSVELLALDVRRLGGEPVDTGLAARRTWLSERLEAWREAGVPIRFPHEVSARNWNALVYRLAQGRGHTGCAGVSMRCVGAGAIFARWWLLEAAPMTIRAVMLYAELAGRGGRELSGATLAVWGDRGRLVPLGRARVDLSEADREAVFAWVKDNTRQRYGPVRSVRPGLVFELCFDGVLPSRRTKAGLSLQEPRVTRFFPHMRLSSVDSLTSLASARG